MPANPVNVIRWKVEVELLLSIPDHLLTVQEAIAIFVVTFQGCLDLFLAPLGCDFFCNLLLLSIGSLHGLGRLPRGLLDPWLQLHERSRRLATDGLSLIDDVALLDEKIGTGGTSAHRLLASLFNRACDSQDLLDLQFVLPHQRRCRVVRALGGLLGDVDEEAELLDEGSCALLLFLLLVLLGQPLLLEFALLLTDLLDVLLCVLANSVGLRFQDLLLLPCFR
mmetsp:Transcript_138084/g.344791  ORF Transcript_138084/g.344791 Transcript_138084/m.344791 type:complete len:223 (-) Transcript_138084:2500-3168(-)